jgi:pilus assembly protein HofO
MLRPERWQMAMAGAWLLMLLVGGYLLQPDAARPGLRRDSLRQQQTQHAALWPRVMRLQQAVVGAQTPPPAATVPFSPVDFQRQDVALVSWMPAGRGGDIVLESAWYQVPATFGLLAERGMQVNAFSIQPGAERLLLTLQLEGGDEH